MAKGLNDQRPFIRGINGDAFYHILSKLSEGVRYA